MKPKGEAVAEVEVEGRIFEGALFKRGSSRGENGVLGNTIDYLADMLLRVQTHPAARIDDLLPHRWTALRPGPS